MKKIFLLFFLVISINTFANKSNWKTKPTSVMLDTTVIPVIQNILLQSFIGKPVDSLLSVLPQSFDYIGFKPARIGYAKGIFLSYGTSESNICHVEIFWDTIQHLPIPNYAPVLNWNVSLAKLETISYVKIIKNNTICIYGCDNSKYY